MCIMLDQLIRDYDCVDKRLELLVQWLKDQQGLTDFSIAPASADASFRRYFRIVSGDTSRIVMDAPPEKEDCRPFIGIARMFHSMGLHVPEILAEDLKLGFLLLSDLGDTQYQSVLNPDSAGQLYADAMQALSRLQTRAPTQTYPLPDYDQALLMREMALFTDWYLGTHLQRQLDDRQLAIIEQAFALLCESALAQPRVFVHRDYHSRNLMFCEDNPGILDFQDAVLGPITYDLVSLLRDCYIAWPQVQVEQWVADYFHSLNASGLLAGIGLETFMRWFDLMGVQRHLKATGIFARLNHRDGKPGYLQDIPRTMNYVRDVAGRYSELKDFAGLLDELSLPCFD